jgi:hypothetical protein
MRDRSAPPEAALSGAGRTGEPAESTYPEPEVHTVYHYHGTVIKVEHAENVNSGDNYGEPFVYLANNI